MLPVEGKSMLPLLKGRERTASDQLCWEWSGNRAIREGNMKLVWDKGVKQWELYDLAQETPKPSIWPISSRPVSKRSLCPSGRPWAERTRNCVTAPEPEWPRDSRWTVRPTRVKPGGFHRGGGSLGAPDWKSFLPNG